ncbi:MAG: DUF4129 domain-containing protein, partial [Dehalococcoidales bacterium]|nr:DUF4129 domain-containing protein [Dehalococcoidales bacterium]
PTPGPPMDVNPLVFWLVILVVFLVVLWIIFITARTMIKRRAQPARTIVIETSFISLGMLGWLKALRAKIGRIWRLVTSHWFKRRAPEEEVSSVRALYRTFLQWAEKTVPRPPSQTALEYEQALSQKFPEKAPDLKLLTGVYVRARYSRNQGSKEEFEAARTAWHKVRAS